MIGMATVDILRELEDSNGDYLNIAAGLLLRRAETLPRSRRQIFT